MSGPNSEIGKHPRPQRRAGSRVRRRGHVPSHPRLWSYYSRPGATYPFGWSFPCSWSSFSVGAFTNAGKRGRLAPERALRDPNHPDRREERIDERGKSEGERGDERANDRTRVRRNVRVQERDDDLAHEHRSADMQDRRADALRREVGEADVDPECKRRRAKGQRDQKLWHGEGDSRHSRVYRRIHDVALLPEGPGWYTTIRRCPDVPLVLGGPPRGGAARGRQEPCARSRTTISPFLYRRRTPSSARSGRSLSAVASGSSTITRAPRAAFFHPAVTWFVQ
jgi:hypothetical protein